MEKMSKKNLMRKVREEKEKKNKRNLIPYVLFFLNFNIIFLDLLNQIYIQVYFF
jgi:hypothetical protein